MGSPCAIFIGARGLAIVGPLLGLNFVLGLNFIGGLIYFLFSHNPVNFL